MEEKRPTGKSFGEQFSDWRLASDATPSEPPKPAPGATNVGSDDPRRLRCGCLEPCRGHSAGEVGNMGYPWATQNAEKQAPEPGSWVTCDRDRMPHRLDPFGWADVCVNPVPAVAPHVKPLSVEEIDKIRCGVDPENPGLVRAREQAIAACTALQARALAEPDSESAGERAAYDRGWNDAIDVFTRNIQASNFERRRQ